MGEFKGEASAARDIKEPVTLADAEPVMNGDVLAAVARLAQRCEVDRPAPQPSSTTSQPFRGPAVCSAAEVTSAVLIMTFLSGRRRQRRLTTPAKTVTV
jgi:hypothetical protein